MDELNLSNEDWEMVKLGLLEREQTCKDRASRAAKKDNDHGAVVYWTDQKMAANKLYWRIQNNGND